MTPFRFLLTIPALAFLASCSTNGTEVWVPAPASDPVERFAGATPNPGFTAPARDLAENPLTKSGDPPQIFITSKMVDIAAKHLEKHDTLTDPQFQVQIRRLAQMKGADLMSAPSVVTRNGQQAKIEIIREMKVKGAAYDESMNLGVTLDVKPAILENGRIHLSGKATVREVDTPETKFGDNTAVSVQSTETFFDTAIKPGHTIQLICRDKDMVGQRIVFINARIIDPAGQEAKLAR